MSQGAARTHSTPHQGVAADPELEEGVDGPAEVHQGKVLRPAEAHDEQARRPGEEPGAHLRVRRERDDEALRPDELVDGGAEDLGYEVREARDGHELAGEGLERKV